MTLFEALTVHDGVLVEFGGLPGVRDLGAVESALARPYCGYYPSIEMKGAALVHSLVLNHGFIDGNKRTAIYMLGNLLAGSGYALQFASVADANSEVEAMVLAVAMHNMSLPDIAKWIRKRLIKM